MEELQSLWMNVVMLISTFDILIDVTSKMGTWENDRRWDDRHVCMFGPQSEMLTL